LRQKVVGSSAGLLDHADEAFALSVADLLEETGEEDGLT
jgi:hypothetical protein